MSFRRRDHPAAPARRRRRTSRSTASESTGFGARGRLPGVPRHPDRYAAQRYAGASGDFTPFHLDADLARAIGLPGIILHGLYTYGQLAHGLLEPLGGDPRALRSLGARFRRPSVPESELTMTGRVESADGDLIRVACSMAQGGRDVLTEGEAVLMPAKVGSVTSHFIRC